MLSSNFFFTATYYVSTDGTDIPGCTNSNTPCKTLQYVLEDLDIGNGHTVMIGSGTFSIKDIDLPDDVTLIGESNEFRNLANDCVAADMSTILECGIGINDEGFWAGANPSFYYLVFTNCLDGNHR